MSKRNDSPEAIATTFEEHEFAASELATIKKTRRRAPRLGQAKAEVYSFRAPPQCKDRIKRRATSDNKTESEVIREAPAAYLG